MAQGLSIPFVSPQLRGLLKPFFDDLTGSGKSSESLEQAVTSAGSGDSQPEESAILELGSTNQAAPTKAAANGFQIAPDGTYQFSRTKLSASFDYSLTQATIQTSQDEDGPSVFASLTSLDVSVSVSAEYEEALIQTGRTRGGDPVANFGNAARQVVERFKAQQIRASINISLSFSQSSVSFNDTGDLMGDLSALAGDETLSGFATLLQAFFGDDEKFADFIKSLEGFMSGVQGSGAAPAASGGADALTQAVADGSDYVTVQSQSLRVSVDLSFESTSIQVSSGQLANASDPVVLDLDGDGVELTSASEGVTFDLDADGSAETAATVTGGDALLALDRNGNRKIDDGRELLGDQNGASNGFKELAKHDSNKDGLINAKDVIFNQLRVLVRGATEESASLGQLLTLSEVGITSISLAAHDVSELASGGNRIAQRAYFTRNDGTTGAAVDALLNRLV